MNTKICKACGTEKTTSEFYKTQSGKPYPYCRDCWSIDMRRRNLIRKSQKDTLSPVESEELTEINQLYDARRASGLSNPGDSKSSPLDTKSLVAAQLQKFQ